MLLKVIVLALCAINGASGISETIKVNLSSPVEVPRNFVGFLGYPWNDTYPEPAFSQTLKAEMWRSSQYAMKSQYVKNPSKFTKAITVVFSDTYKYPYSDPEPENPLTNKSALISVATKFAQDCLDLRTSWNWPADKFYIDIWNEPDGTFRGWSTKSEDFFGVFKVVHDIVRKIIPNVKIVGPSLAYYYETYLFQFLNYSLKNNITLEAFSWHDLGGTNPGSTGDLDWNHFQYRIQRWSTIIRNDTYKPLGINELHIQEFFMRGDTNASYYNPYVAGMHLGAMTQLEKTGDLINYVGKACWKEGFGQTLGCGGASSPNIGSSFAIANKLPLPMWWFWKVYADGRNYRVESQTSSININAISSYRIPGKIDSNETGWGTLPTRMNRTIFTSFVSKNNASFYTQVMMSAWKTNGTTYPKSDTNITIYNAKFLVGDIVYVQTHHFPGVWGDKDIVTGTSTLDDFGTAKYTVSSSRTIKLPTVSIQPGDNGMYLYTLVNDCGDCVNGNCKSLSSKVCECDQGWNGRYCDQPSSSASTSSASTSSASTSSASTTDDGYSGSGTTGEEATSDSTSGTATTSDSVTSSGKATDSPIATTTQVANAVSSSTLLIWSSTLVAFSLFL